MIKIGRILVHCDQDECTVANEEELSILREILADELKIKSSHITFTYEEQTDGNQTT